MNDQKGQYLNVVVRGGLDSGLKSWKGQKFGLRFLLSYTP